MTQQHSLEILLAKAYDDLVDQNATDISFKQEAIKVARFTRLYIQNLFQLDETAFKSIMRKNRSLHEKATRNQQRGKDPLNALRQQIRRQDDLGKILDRHSRHLGALDCILDTRATAALVHHILHLKPPENLPAKVIGCEFGSGTGILSVVGTIPFVHRGTTVTVYSFEQSKESREDAMKIVQILKRESRFKDQIHFHVVNGDVTTEHPYRTVKKAEETHGPVALWISETFGYQSQSPIVSKDATQCDFTNPAGIPAYSPDLEKKYDPLQLVINHSCHYFQPFLKKIRDRQIAAFPDFVTPKVVINGKKSALLSPDGTWKKLHQLGRPYDMLPPCVPTRWFFKEQTESSKKGKKRR